MTCEKCFISTNILKGYNLTKHGSKRQIKMFMVRFTLGINLLLVWHVKSVKSQPTFWKVVTWHNMVPKDKLKCSWLASLWGEIFHLSHNGVMLSQYLFWWKWLIGQAMAALNYKSIFEGHGAEWSRPKWYGWNPHMLRSSKHYPELP